MNRPSKRATVIVVTKVQTVVHLSQNKPRQERKILGVAGTLGKAMEMVRQDADVETKQIVAGGQRVILETRDGKKSYILTYEVVQ